MICRMPLHLNMTVDGVVVTVCEVVGVGLVDLEVVILELYSSFVGRFCLELGGVKEWNSGEVISIVAITSSF